MTKIVFFVMYVFELTFYRVFIFTVHLLWIALTYLISRQKDSNILENDSSNFNQ